MVADGKLEQYFTQTRISWELIPAYRQAALQGEWEAIYGNVWKLGLRHKHGARAQDAYCRRSAELFLIVPFLGDHAGPHALGRRGPRTNAYQCRGTGKLPDLSEFSGLDFFISPPDLNWTMLHTHEDYSLGGPYFIEKEWLVPPIRRRGNLSGEPLPRFRSLQCRR